MLAYRKRTHTLTFPLAADSADGMGLRGESDGSDCIHTQYRRKAPFIEKNVLYEWWWCGAGSERVALAFIALFWDAGV